MLSLAQEQVDVIAVQESHLRRTDEEPHLPGYSSYRADCIDEIKRGMLTYIRKEYKPYTFVCDRLRASELWLRVQGYPFSETRPGLIVNMHWPTMTMKQVGYAVEALKKHSAKYPMLVLGDLNIHPPKSINWQDCWFGDESTMLGKVVCASKGVIGRYSTEPTSHFDARSSSTLDYIISPASWSNQLIDTAVLGGLCGSDHRPVICSWCIDGYVRSPDTWLTQQEIAMLSDNIIESFGVSAVSDFQTLIDATNASINDIISRRHPKSLRKYWESNGEIQYWRRRLNRAYKRYSRSLYKDYTAWMDWKEASHRLREVCRWARYDSWARFIDRMELMGKTDPRSYYMFVRKIAGDTSKVKRVTSLQSPEGDPLGPSEIAAELVTHFSEVFSPRPFHDDAFKEGIKGLRNELQTSLQSPLRQLSEWGGLMQPIVGGELSRALLDCNSWTAPGTDGIPMEFWKLVSKNKDMLALLASMFNSILQTGAIPSSWHECYCMPIPKVQRPTLASEYRGITITQTAYRIFMKVIQTRMTEQFEDKGIICEEQAGFRRNYNTTQQVAALTEIAERKMASHDPLNPSNSLYTVFLDIKQAYDCVHLDVLALSLETLGLPERFVKLILGMYRESKMIIRVRGTENRSFTASNGIKQGCPCAPLLFTVIINDLIKHLSKGPRLYIPGITPAEYKQFNHGRPINSLFYADDGLLLGNSVWAIQQLLNSTAERMKVLGLQLNVSKCKAMKITKGQDRMEAGVFIDGKEIEEVDSFEYLGLHVDRRMSRPTMATQRDDKLEEKMGWLQHLLYRTWHSPLHIRAKMARAVGAGVLLYGSEIWAFGPQDLEMKKQIGRIARSVWGAPEKGNLNICSLELGFGDLSFTTTIKRMKLLDTLEKRTSGPLKVLYVTRDSGRLLKDMERSVLFLQIGDEHKEQLMKNEISKEIRMRYIPKLLPEEDGKDYLTKFWLTREVSKETTKMPITHRFYHMLRMDNFYDWTRICWWKRLAAQPLKCGFCGSEGRETREHLLLDCRRWEPARKAFLEKIVEENANLSREKLVVLLLGGWPEGKMLQAWASDAVMAFLDVVLHEREAIRKKL